MRASGNCYTEFLTWKGMSAQNHLTKPICWWSRKTTGFGWQIKQNRGSLSESHRGGHWVSGAENGGLNSPTYAAPPKWEWPRGLSPFPLLELIFTVRPPPPPPLILLDIDWAILCPAPPVPYFLCLCFNDRPSLMFTFALTGRETRV